MRSRAGVLLGTAGLAVMVAASAWAPLQPELINTGGACQLAPCGTLEDPERWRQAWWVWSVGALVSTVAAAFVLAPRRLDSRSALLALVVAVVIVVPVAVLAFVLSLLTSVQGVATAVVVVPLVVAAILGSWVRADRAVD